MQPNVNIADCGTLTGHFCGTLFHNMFARHSCRTLCLERLLCDTFLCDTVLGNSCKALGLDTFMRDS